MRIFLVGYMGCGKSTIGKKSARQLGVEHLDTDRIIENEEGSSVSALFNQRGEAEFRALERSAIEGVIASGLSQIISTGGGVPIWGDNMAFLRDNGIVIYIRRSVDNIISRLSPFGREKRPRISGLSDSELREFMLSDLSKREPFYKAADIIIEADHLSDKDIVDIVVNSIKLNK